jgi:CheY-like chemotaxis protein
LVRRSRTESTLRESEERFRTTFNMAAVGIAQVGIDGKFLRVNETLCQTLGYTAQALTRLLKSLSHEVVCAHSGEEGLRRAAQNNFDLMISDIGLPDFSGWELLRRLRQVSAVKAVALSGFGTEEDRRRSRSAGFVAHLVKPVDVIRLENVINDIVAPATVRS